MWTTGPGGVIDRPMESWSAFTGQTDEAMRGDGWTEAIHAGRPRARRRRLEGGRRGARRVRLRVPSASGGRRVPLDRGARGAAAGRGRRAAVLRRGARHHQAQAGRGGRAPARGTGEHRGHGLDAAGRRVARHGGSRRRLRARRDGTLSRRRPRESLPAGARWRPPGARPDLASRDRAAGGRGHAPATSRSSAGCASARPPGSRSSSIRSATCRRRRGRSARCSSAMGLEAVLAVPVLQEPTLVGLLAYEIEAGTAGVRGVPLEGRRRLADSPRRRPARQPHRVAGGRAQPAEHRRQLPRLRAGRRQEPDADLPRGGADHHRRRRAVHAPTRPRARDRDRLERARRTASRHAGRGSSRRRRDDAASGRAGARSCATCRTPSTRTRARSSSASARGPTRASP